MLRSFNLSAIPWKDPRIVTRAILGMLLAANLVMAVIAFKPFGGSADDLRRERFQQQQQLTSLQAQVVKSKKLVEKVQAARIAGDEFLHQFVTDKHVVASTIQGELISIAENSGVALQPALWTPEAIEGSDTLYKLTLNLGCQGTYQSLAKFLNLVDRSPRFLIIESLTATPLQTGDKLNVVVKVDTFIQQRAGEEAPAPAAAAPAEPGGAGL
jgi:Tfp pilus assembly protein PilO